MMTSLKKSRDLGYHFDLFWKYLWLVRYLPEVTKFVVNWTSTYRENEGDG